ncbi:hypothetical protein C4D60_Mb07t10740 [Musa balbisiana]|uniref:Uncharacterized protein n=1 Tax=Musa balbisiana TaxID=52838 RepID=A0A4S8JEF8_MUSBA|nr:hypothetical protein C4D60_Mb07t10740 [Musa balbisiana]
MYTVPVHLLTLFAASALFCCRTLVRNNTKFTPTPKNASVANPWFTASRLQRFQRQIPKSLVGVGVGGGGGGFAKSTSKAQVQDPRERIYHTQSYRRCLLTSVCLVKEVGKIDSYKHLISSSAWQECASTSKEAHSSIREAFDVKIIDAKARKDNNYCCLYYPHRWQPWLPSMCRQALYNEGNGTCERCLLAQRPRASSSQGRPLPVVVPATTLGHKGDAGLLRALRPLGRCLLVGKRGAATGIGPEGTTSPTGKGGTPRPL